MLFHCAFGSGNAGFKHCTRLSMFLDLNSLKQLEDETQFVNTIEATVLIIKITLSKVKNRLT